MLLLPFPSGTFPKALWSFPASPVKSFTSAHPNPTILNETQSPDSHGHILEYGAMTQLPLEGTRSIAGNHDHTSIMARRPSHFYSPETVDRVREYILSSPALRNDTTQWIRGGGWDHTVWPEGFPTAVRLFTSHLDDRH